MRQPLTWVLGLCAVVAVATPARTDDLTALSRDFWSWRASTQPVTRDDVPRPDRPHGFAPDWSADAVNARRAQLSSLEARWRSLADAQAAAPAQVDQRLLGSALARVRWEIDGVRSWRR